MHYLMSWSADDGGEDGPRSVVSGETGLAHTGTIVHNQSLNITVICHYAEVKKLPAIDAPARKWYE